MLIQREQMMNPVFATQGTKTIMEFVQSVLKELCGVPNPTNAYMYVAKIQPIQLALLLVSAMLDLDFMEESVRTVHPTISSPTDIVSLALSMLLTIPILKPVNALLDFSPTNGESVLRNVELTKSTTVQLKAAHALMDLVRSMESVKFVHLEQLHHKMEKAALVVMPTKSS